MDVGDGGWLGTVARLLTLHHLTERGHVESTACQHRLMQDALQYRDGPCQLIRSKVQSDAPEELAEFVTRFRCA